MCNPSKHGDLEYIDECNRTKAWQPYDGGLHTACLYNDATTSTFPFKNIFCYFCNRNNNNGENFIDFNTNINESIKLLNNTNELVYTYLITTDINMEYFRESMESRVRHDDTVSVKDVHVRNFHYSYPVCIVNLTNLLKQYASLTNEDKNSINVCPSRTGIIPNNTNVACNCDPFCAFHSSNCCLDAMLELPVTCLKIEGLSSSNIEGITNNSVPVSWCAERGGRISQVVPPPSAQKSADNGGRLPIKVVATTIAQRSVYTINTTKKEPGFNFLRFSPSIHWIVRFCKG